MTHCRKGERSGYSSQKIKKEKETEDCFWSESRRRAGKNREKHQMIERKPRTVRLAHGKKNGQGSEKKQISSVAPPRTQRQNQRTIKKKNRKEIPPGVNQETRGPYREKGIKSQGQKEKLIANPWKVVGYTTRI